MKKLQTADSKEFTISGELEEALLFFTRIYPPMYLKAIAENGFITDNPIIIEEAFKRLANLVLHCERVEAGNKRLALKLELEENQNHSLSKEISRLDDRIRELEKENEELKESKATYRRKWLETSEYLDEYIERESNL